VSSNKFWGGTHHGPRSSNQKYGEPEAFYIIEHTNGKDGGSFYLRVLRRKVIRYQKHGDAVRYDGQMYKLHPVSDLPALISSLGGAAHFDFSEDFDTKKHEKLRFIKYYDKNEKTWEP